MRSRQLRVSLVIPAYNEASYLAKCLESAQSQTIELFEIIVVDNNSSDNTRQIVAKNSSVKLINEPRQGVSFANWAGFEFASGDLVARIDADTILQPNWAQTVSDYFQTNTKVAAVTGKCYFYNLPLKRLVSGFHASIYQRLQGLIVGTNVLWASNMVIRKSTWLDVKSRLHLGRYVNEDIDLTIILKKNHYKVARLTNLRADVSFRRGDMSLRGNLRYLYRWPANYFRNNSYIRGTLITLLAAVIFIVYVPIRLISLAVKLVS